MSSPEPLLIDVRSPGEYAGGYLDGAVNLPLDQLQGGIARVAPDLDQPIVLYCASGGRSGMGCMLLQQMGYRQVSNGGGIGMLAMSSQRPVRRL
ncbi:rhodanese-like domain-containing protein [Ideonella sp. B508-1]|uniref:rhodanese-like domain-containing protein n=1 Tax=Ideonella sp. B508-1 TaxID=137716 RepID=UPI0003465360|nr:rhodanese-like domain-containing protein [Ideonella sp. B508-1]